MARATEPSSEVLGSGTLFEAGSALQLHILCKDAANYPALDIAALSTLVTITFTREDGSILTSTHQSFRSNS
jgi:hypothetical protein